MPTVRISGDLLHAFDIEVEADTQDDAIAKVEAGEVDIDGYDTGTPGVRVDDAILLDEDEIEG